MGLPAKIKTNNAPSYLSAKLPKFQWDVKHVTGIPYIPQGQTIIEKHNRTLKEMSLKQNGGYGGI